MWSIGLISNHEIFRVPFEGYLKTEDCAVASYDNVTTFLEKYPVTVPTPDLVLLEAGETVGDTAHIIGQLRTSFPLVKYVVISGYTHVHFITTLLNAGADAVVSKSARLVTVLQAIDAVLNGDRLFVDNSGIVTQCSVAYMTSIKKEFGYLTSRQRDFLKLCAKPDLTYKEIARKMDISLKTADRYRDDLFKKLGICSRTGLALYALQTGIAELITA